MKRSLVFSAFLALFVFALSASAQKTTDFSGTWNLQVGASETRIESQTLKVTQTATDVKVERTTKMKETATAPGGGAPGGGGRGFGGGMGGPQDYGIGTPIKVTRQTPNGDVELSMSAKIDGNKLTLTTSSPMGARSETWTLNADGTLSIESQGRDGSVTRTYKK